MPALDNAANKCRYYTHIRQSMPALDNATNKCRYYTHICSANHLQ
jgi:hypothetical protein